MRDQAPLSVGRLEACLVDLSLDEWLALLNSFCFFWPTRERVERLLSADLYTDRDHDVLVVDTAELVRRHHSRVRLSAINTGATRPFAWPRGSDTFKSLEEFPLVERLKRVGRSGAVAEVVVKDAVPDVGDFTVRVERWHGSAQTGIAWER